MPGESLFNALEPLLERVNKPIQYVGGELNSTVKDWHVGGHGPDGEELTTRWALMYPDAYEVGVPNQGVMILYEVLNERADALAERTYAVWPDMEAQLREADLPQFTVDAHRSVRDFDLFGLSFSTELGYTNMLTALDLAGIPLHAVDRGLDDPIVIAGGHAAFNPEPVASFIDAAIVGDGEQAVLTVTDIVGEWKAQGRPGGRREVLLRLARTGGVYVPAFYEVSYLPDGRIQRVAPAADAAGVPWRVAKHTVMDLDAWPYPKQPLVPLAESVHERMSVEIFRGCTRGCRFCQAGMITRPVRERSITGIGEMVERGLAATGFEEVGLLSLQLGRPLRDRRPDQGSRRPLRGHPDGSLAAVDPRRRLQHRPRQRADPQRSTLGPDVRARGRLRAHPQGHQQDGVRGGPHPDRRRGLRRRLEAGQALLHVRAAHRDRRGRAPDRRARQEGHRDRAAGLGSPRHPLHRLDRRLRAQAAHAVPVGLAARCRGDRRAPGQAPRGDPRRQALRLVHRLPLPRRPARHRRGAALTR